MNPRPVEVWPLDNFALKVKFSDGDVRCFLATAYLHYPAFHALRDPGFFRQCRVERGTVTWPDGTDFCPDTLYLESKPIP
ncbi:MAG: DUF2442 domain-containing protein [Myxococcales bacterium]|nr:DUF2442 domain-containing protein [Myxococcales bacterium]